jgi:O-phosphoseryl-tRNA(Cys) synthetase
MSKYKVLPKISKSDYEVSEELNINKYKLTQESREFRDKVVDFVNKQKLNHKNLETV